MTSAPDALAKATALHRDGRLADAYAAYQRVLAGNPNEIEAVHGLALIAIDLGKPAEAVPLLARCIVANPDTVLYRLSLGVALLAKGDAEDAAGHLLDAANRAPHILEPRLHLARALGALNRWSQAVDVMADAAKNFPDRAEAWAAKGNAERALLRHEDAEGSLRKALALAPNDPDILNNLGVVAKARGRMTEAISYYRQALALRPNGATIHANLGNAFSQLGQAALAEQHLREAVALDPKSAENRCNLAIHLTTEERPDDAVPHFRSVLAKAPKHVDAWTNLGVAYLATGDTAEAERCYRQAMGFNARNAEAHYNLAWVLLLTGRWAEGWQEYEWRWRLPHFSSKRRDFSQPMWDGSPLPNGTLLLHAEQGLGDAIQFARYAALAKQRCGRVIVECHRPLARLFQKLAGADQVFAAGDPLPPFDAHTPFMSLPRIFGTTTATVPAAGPYLSAPEIPSHLRLTGTRRKIGLVWAGSPDNKIDRRRTIAAELFIPVMKSVDADFVSLQVGARSEEVSALPGVVFACEGNVKDFADTAAVVGQLDLVLGVDTAVMHLAAAMGKPTWMLIPFMPDYRWLLERVDLPWYRAVRLFRQTKPGDWPEALARAARALTDWQP